VFSHLFELVSQNIPLTILMLCNAYLLNKDATSILICCKIFASLNIVDLAAELLLA
jgi:hypothetical protein